MDGNNAFVSGAALPRVHGTAEQTHAAASASKQTKLARFFKAQLQDPNEHEIKTRDRSVFTPDDCKKTLTEVFGHSDYKGKQKEIIESAIRGLDVFVVAPTGMGKSICFQVPAATEKDGVTFIISPLLALMKNQMSMLQELKVPAAAYTSDTLASEKKKVLADLQSIHPAFRLLYITPEMLSTAEFNKLVAQLHRKGEINRLVIDEAHCVSEWGHDFRPEYRKLGLFRENYPDVPIMALTASATTSVQNDIVKNLRLDQGTMLKVVHPFNRDNLFYEIRYASSPSQLAQMADVHQFISLLHQRRGRPSSGIVYCRNRATCDELAKYLRGNGIQARPYHRGLKSKLLDKTLNEWQRGGDGSGAVDVVCATIAFGMGIDKPDVRYIVHFDLPKSLEGYYQETGRAGRDGDPAKCVLYYSREDALRVRQLVRLSQRDRKERAMTMPLQFGATEPSRRGMSSFSALVRLAEDIRQCRHISICKYFGEEIDTNNSETNKSYCNNMCDICKYPDKTKKRKTELTYEDWIVSQIEQLKKASVEEANDVADDHVDFDGLDGGFEDEDWGDPNGTEDEDVYSKIQEQSVQASSKYDSDQSNAQTMRTTAPPMIRPPPAVKCPAANSYSIDLSKRPRMDYSKPTGGLSIAARRPYKVPFKEVPQNKVEVEAPEQRIVGNAKDASGLKNAEIPVTAAADDRPPQQQDLDICDELGPREDDPQGVVFEIESSDSEVQGSDNGSDEERIEQETSHASSTVPKAGKTNIDLCDRICEKTESSDDDDNERPRSKKSSKERSLSPEAQISHDDNDDDKEMDKLEIAFSKKIKLSLREDALSKIKTALHGVLMKHETGEKRWKTLGVRTPWHEERSKLLAQAARALEFNTFLMSATDSGYHHRAEWTICAIQELVRDEAWDESGLHGDDDGSDKLARARNVAATVQTVLKDK